MIGNMKHGVNDTRTCETAAGIGFGKAVSQGTNDRGAILGGTLAGFVGITIKDMTLVHSLAALDKYSRYEEMGIRVVGDIWVKPGAAVAAGDPVYFHPTTGVLSNAAGVFVAGTPGAAGNTGAGTCTLANPATGAGVMVGTYTARLVEVVTGAGVFEVTRPDGTVDGQAVVGVAYDGQVKFTIADGDPDFTVGDKFTIAVTADSVGPIPGARWTDSAAQNGSARVNLGIQK